MMCNDKGRIIGGIMSHSTWVQNEGLWSKGHSIMILGFAFKKMTMMGVRIRFASQEGHSNQSIASSLEGQGATSDTS